MIRRRAPQLSTGAVVLAVALAIVPAMAATAYVPEPEPVARAAAKVNRSAKRAQALEIEVTVRPLGSDEWVARGRLLASPDARTRLEIRHRRGFVERHLRRSGGLLASRDGKLLERARPLLPPFWVLQTRSGSRLLARLGELGGDPAVLTLGYDGGHDCYVLGGREGPSIWVDQDTLAVVRIDLGGGIVYRMGPVQGEEKGIQLPAWIETEAPGMAPMRLELGSAKAVKPATTAFRPEWLTAPR